MKSSIVLSVAVSVYLVGCASPTVIQTVKPGDSGLSCAQLQNEYSDAERFRNEADKEKGMTGGNVARAILFWPAILGSFSNANEAISAADARKIHMANLMSQKNCPVPVSISAQASPSDQGKEQTPSVPTGTPAAQRPVTLDDKLAELKRLYEAKLITNEVYVERQKALLGN
jgi:hypothetical protein